MYKDDLKQALNHFKTLRETMKEDQELEHKKEHSLRMTKRISVIEKEMKDLGV